MEEKEAIRAGRKVGWWSETAQLAGREDVLWNSKQKESSLTASITNHLTPVSGPLDPVFRLQLYSDVKRTTYNS